MKDLSCLGAVLVAEDDFLIATDMERVLAKNGCRRVDMVGSCAQAIERIALTRYDLVIVDIKLSDGTCEDLVALLDQQEIPYVFVTGYNRDAYPDWQAPWLSKPLSDDGLLTAVCSGLKARSGHGNMTGQLLST